ncbi:MAG: type IV pilin protein [Candidatus Anammoxibacter sp.]
MNTIKKRLTKSGGFSLMEIVIVVGIIAALVGIVAPMGIKSVRRSQVVRAVKDTTNLGAMIGTLITDVGTNALAKNPRGDVRKLILEGPGLIPLGLNGETDYLESIWSSIAVGGIIRSPEGETDGDIGKLRDHLTDNDMNGNGIIGEAFVDYDSDWRGPYMAEIKADPWGFRYLVLALGIREGVQVDGDEMVFGWVISAGPNGRIETSPFSSKLEGDDVGVMLGRGEGAAIIR